MNTSLTILLALNIMFVPFLLPYKAFAEDARVCHCFKNRVYNPADRFAADEYLIASSFNSVISKKYAIPKKQIVFLKMKGGVSHVDLIVASKVAHVTGNQLQFILNLLKSGRTWQEILFLPDISSVVRKDKLLNELMKGKHISVVGPEIAYDLVGEFFGFPSKAVKHLRELGVDEKEMVVVFVLSETQKIEPSTLVEQHQAGKSWSQVAFELGVSPSDINELIRGYGKPQER